MGYGLTDRDELDESLLFVGDWTCACGRTQTHRREIVVRAGATTTSSLLHLCLSLSERVCSCRRPLLSEHGQSVCLYGLPGDGPTLASVLRGRPGIGRYADYLLARGSADAIARRGRGIPAGTSDYELSHLAGRPASVRAAWHDALMASLMTGGSVSFPCGPGVSLVLEREGESSPVADGPERIMIGGGADPWPSWLSAGPEHRSLRLFASVDRDAALSGLRREYATCELEADPAKKGVVRFPGSPIGVNFDAWVSIEEGLRRGLDPSHQMIRDLLIARRLLRRHEALAQEIRTAAAVPLHLASFDPQTHRAVFESRSGRVAVPFGELAFLDDRERRGKISAVMSGLVRADDAQGPTRDISSAQTEKSAGSDGARLASRP